MSTRRKAAGAAVPPADPAAGPVALGTQAAIRDAAALHARLAAALATGRIEVDAGEIHHVDTAVLQLLLSARRTAAARGVPYAWRAASPDLVRAAARIGLADALALPASG